LNLPTTGDTLHQKSVRLEEPQGGFHQIDFGHEQTALIHERQIVKD
jgi:hypothetical protein